MRPQQNKKMIAGLVSAVGAAVLALCLLATGAFAAPNPGPGSDGPQSANIPYVAWVGEHVRLVVCDPAPIPDDELQPTYDWVRSWGMLEQTASPVTLVQPGTRAGGVARPAGL